MTLALLRSVSNAEWRYQALMFVCPGCESEDEEGRLVGGLHMLPVSGNPPGARWDFDGNLEAPTLSPSILTRHEHARKYVDGELKDIGLFVCHSYLRAGQFEFLADCTHKFAGSTVPMRELYPWVERE